MEPFKEFINGDVIQTLGRIFTRVSPDFDGHQFVKLATNSLEKLELKQRVLQVRDALDATLPQAFDQRCNALLASLHSSEDTDRDGIKFSQEGVSGFAIWPLTELVARCGMDHPEQSLAVLKEMTKRFSSEFAVRPFILEHEAITLDVFQGWVTDKNRHVRRLVSEGARPRLPWGIRLNRFVDDPSPLFPLLTALKDDPEEYVRRSVANNLNDIAKDHPAKVVAVAAKWATKVPATRLKLLKHACRTLIKDGNADALAIFGYGPANEVTASISVASLVVKYGESLEFDVKFAGLSVGENLMVDYKIHFVKANGTSAPKVFKWMDKRSLKSSFLSASRCHAIKPITTRKYYSGTHILELIVNGTSVGSVPFELEIS